VQEEVATQEQDSLPSLCAATKRWSTSHDSGADDRQRAMPAGDGKARPLGGDAKIIGNTLVFRCDDEAAEPWVSARILCCSALREGIHRHRWKTRPASKFQDVKFQDLGADWALDFATELTVLAGTFEGRRTAGTGRTKRASERAAQLAMAALVAVGSGGEKPAAAGTLEEWVHVARCLMGEQLAREGMGCFVRHLD